MWIACLVSDEEYGCKLSNDCFTMCVALSLLNLTRHASLKCHVKVDTNMIDTFCSNNETKSSTPFQHLMALRYKGYATGGIRARVETLGPNWAQNAPTYFVSKLMIDFFLVIIEINKSTLFGNTAPGLHLLTNILSR